MRILFTHSFSLSGAHTLAQPHLSEEKIKEFYSVCGKPHGHLYQVEVTYDFSDTPKGQATEEFLKLKSLTEGFFERELSGKNLNENFSNTAGEALSPAFLSLLREKEFGSRVVSLAIQETAKNRFLSFTGNEI